MRTWLFLGVAAAGILIWIVAMPSDPAEQELQELKRRNSEKRNETQLDDRDVAAELAQLRAEGRGQAVPKALTLGRYPEGTWFVEDPVSKARVSVPFKPGQLAAKPPELVPVHSNPGFVGAGRCEKCHQEKHDTFVQTAHFRTSRLASRDDIAGSFQPGQNTLSTSNYDVSFAMESDADGMRQRVRFFGWQFETPIDLVFGSSKMGESHAFWDGERLYQANCSYLTESDRWINSPGFRDGDATYDRPIFPGCIECHITYVDVRKMPNHYTPQSLIPGVSCERCHGPGQEHAEFHEANPEVKQSRFVSVPSELTRQQQLDVCGQCHSSNKRLNDRPAFQFRPGDRLEDHYDMVELEAGDANEVHTSNQAARLALSECFRQSEMACIECHDPHHNERGNSALFSQRCLKCHQTEQCGMDREMGEALADNCIDCHMPLRAGRLFSESASGRIFPPLRDHHVRVDADATRRYLRESSKR